ncbi:sushi/von Willebrand factor type a/egf/pentraxin domain-containing 1 [Plakobranchus ocellatus]|uniref:Sushi/von Willebrand factor type a/egf/pentraxin domain-containing 1 n=1 Tax=Plakobranchus ocellatus TaxID=259542 RepID=A0AAV4C8I7_9GAST|nr:sushi/von Willebrand factor type a/egf/pentraxin domain-containing 1 [Plakobranchus ocellatus]
MDAALTSRSTRDAFPGLVSPDIEIAYGGEAVYTCSPGYTPPAGSSFISSCQATEPGAPLPTSGVTRWTVAPLHRWLAPATLIMPPPRTAKHECIEPAVVEGEVGVTSTCTENGNWSTVSMAFLSVPCGTAPPLANGRVVYNITDGSFRAIYTCDTGFVLESDATERQCMPGLNTWSNQSISCSGVECGAAPEVSHATVAGTDRRFPAQITYTCNRGYSLTSSASTRTCNQDGSWSSENVICEPVVCDPPTLPEFTVFTPDVVKLRDSYGTEIA